ncbi:MAG: DNA repair protein RadA [Patescibacteria group bacterium]
MAKKPTIIYLCDQCGNEFPVWAGKCSMCGAWNSLKELKIESSSAKASRASRDVSLYKIAEIKADDFSRILTGISEFDRVMGGGIVPGSITLIGGEPGIGKSTLILQVASSVGGVMYNSAEESAQQIKMRADRLGVGQSDITLLSEPNVEAVLDLARKNKPKLLIIDSIQTVTSDNYDATAGSIVQVRECGIILQQFAKSSGIPVFEIGHVTKEGNLAGPKILEHLVDTVLYLEGERFNDARILRGVKNRFGATDEIGIFSMQGKGMVEVTNPSELFLSERQEGPGSVVTVAIEGTRPLLVEIQAIVVPTHFGYPKRTSSGFDLNRLNLLAAVVSKNGGLDLSNHDIYLNVVGGMKLKEPAADLAVCAAIISSAMNKSFGKDSCLFGEVGLMGETRNVTRKAEREKESKKLGFAQIKVDSIRELNEKLGTK